MKRASGKPKTHLRLAALVLALIVSGCATAQPSGRKGLLEGVSEADHSHRNNRFAAIDRSPAARAVDSDSSPSVAGKRLSKSGAKIAPPPQHPATEIAVGALSWPLATKIQVTSPFGQRGKEFHEGVDLKAQQGTPVLAAQEGTVIYAGSKIRGYGKMVVIRHFRQISTIYAHNSRLLVRIGQYVRQGQKIAISGRTGHVTGPHLHFEVRDGLSALNPMALLPSIHADVPETAPIPKRAHAQRVAVSRVSGTGEDGRESSD